MKEQKSIHNAIIDEIGLYFTPHYNSMTIHIELHGNDWSKSAEMYVGNVSKLVRCILTSDNYEAVEDGLYIHELEKTCVKAMFDGKNPCSSKLIAIGGILADADDEDDFVEMV